MIGIFEKFHLLCYDYFIEAKQIFLTAPRGELHLSREIKRLSNHSPTLMEGLKSMPYKAWFAKFWEEFKTLSGPDNDPNWRSNRQRILTLNSKDARGVSTCLPLYGNITEEDQQNLYMLAKKGELFVYPLGEIISKQVLPEGEILFKSLDVDVNGFLKKRIERPVKQQLGFFKQILNWVFNLFSEEKQRYEDEYRRDCTTYLFDRNAQTCTRLTNKNAAFSAWRENQISHFFEPLRENLPERIERTEKVINNSATPSWEKDAYKVRLRLLNDLRMEESPSYNEETAHSYLTTLFLSSYLKKKKEIAKKIQNEPEQMEDLRLAIFHSKHVKDMVQKDQKIDNRFLIALGFSSGSGESMLSGFCREEASRKIVCKMLLKEGKIKEFEDSLAGMREMFQNETVTERMVELEKARLALPEEELSKKMTYKDGTSATIRLNHIDIPLDDPRVLKIYENNRASEENLASSASSRGGLGKGKNPLIKGFK